MIIQVSLMTILIVTLCSCQSDQSTNEKLVELEDSITGSEAWTPADHEDLETPMALWSKTKRDSTAGFYFLMGEYLSLKGDGGSAHKFFETAYNLDPNSFLAGKYLDSGLYKASDQSTTLKARKLSLLYPTNIRIRLHLCDLYIKEKKFDAALKEIDKIIKLNPGLEQAYIRRIDILQKAGFQDLAIKGVRSLTKRFPGSVFGWAMLSKILLAEKNFRSALPAAKRAWQIRPDNPELLMTYARITELVHGKNRALDLWDQFFHPKVSHEEIVARSVLFFKLFGSLRQSLAYLTELSKTRIGSLENVQVQRVFLLWELKKNQEAAELMEYLVAESSYSAWLTYLLGEAYLRNGKSDKAKERFFKVIEHSDFYVPSRIKISRIYRSESRLQEALDVFLSLLPSHYASWETYILASQVLGDLKKYPDAIDVLDQGYARFPLKTRLLFLRGVYEEKANLIEQCIKTMRQVIEREPTYSSAYNYLGYLFAEMDENLDEAEQLILKALELKPDDGYYLDSLGWVYFMQGHIDKALPVFFEALQKAPGEGVIMEHIGDVYRLQKNSEEALKYYKKALERQLDDQDRERIKSKIKEFN